MGSNPARDAFKPSVITAKSSQKSTKETLERVINSRASGTSPKTFRIYHLALDRFIGYPLTPEGTNTCLNSLTCGNAKHNYYRCIKTLCRWLYLTNNLPTDPIGKALPPRRQKKILPAISKEQLLDNCPAKRDKATLNLLWYSGMRFSEAASVRVQDFNRSEGTVVVPGKGNRYRKALAGNGNAREWFYKHDSLEWIEVYEKALPGDGTSFIPTPCSQYENAPCVNACPGGGHLPQRGGYCPD